MTYLYLIIITIIAASCDTPVKPDTPYYKPYDSDHGQTNKNVD